MDPGEEERCVRSARRGDRAAFDLLVARYLPRILAVARAFARDDHAAGDISQVAFLRAWQGLATLADPARFGPWLQTIARNTARNWRRDHARDEKSLADDAPEPVDPRSVPVRSDAEDPVRAAVECLAEELREVILLRYASDLSYEEIAAALEIPLSKVRDRLFRAKLALKKLLAEGADFSGPPRV